MMKKYLFELCFQHILVGSKAVFFIVAPPEKKNPHYFSLYKSKE